MLSPSDAYFMQTEEPIKSCLQFLREYLLKLDSNITEKWQYGMPFFYYKDKRLCYLWVHKKIGQPYLGFVEGKKINHPDLLQEKRVKMKILIINPCKDIPVNKIKIILKQAISLSNS